LGAVGYFGNKRWPFREYLGYFGSIRGAVLFLWFGSVEWSILGESYRVSCVIDSAWLEVVQWTVVSKLQTGCGHAGLGQLGDDIGLLESCLHIVCTVCCEAVDG